MSSSVGQLIVILSRNDNMISLALSLYDFHTVYIVVNVALFRIIFHSSAFCNCPIDMFKRLICKIADIYFIGIFVLDLQWKELINVILQDVHFIFIIYTLCMS